MWLILTLYGSAVTVKWPYVPACYGWLSLDRRGRWRLKGEIVSHAGLIAFINSRYGPDDSGNWIFSNGPQAVYVALEYTPLVLRLQVDGALIAHTGAMTGPATAAYIDDEGSALLETSLGFGLLDDRELVGFLGACIDVRGAPATDEALLAAIAGDAQLFWQGMPLQRIRRRDVALRFGFRPDPCP
ncbi:MAG: DUF2946 family protein [Sulfuritalea sp.]|nr:DUF2946 family protein [Sulfuritalea sp.]